MKTFLIFMLIFTTSLLAQDHLTKPAVNRADFIKGGDLSELLAIETHGGVFTENGLPKDALAIFSDHGINYVRLRIWHTPAQGYNNLDRTLQMASRIKSAGLKFLLDFHYSDTWADPAQQAKPAAWATAPFETLKDSVFQYTRQVMTALKQQNTLPDMVQIGNEIICGLLWNDGRVCDPFNNSQHWSQLAELIDEGLRGVNESLDPGDTVRTMIHIDRGGDNGGSRWFFDHLLAQNVEFDIIGLSFYTWWHGSLSTLESNLHDLAQRYGKAIILVETAYPWTLAWNDNTNNIVGNSSQLHPGYPATVAGQKNFLYDILNIVRNIPNNQGAGVFYWAPDWIAAPQWGSPWENLALFDFSGEVLNSIDAFDSTLSGLSEIPNSPYSFHLDQNYPNPFNPDTRIRYELPQSSQVILKIYNILGQEVRKLVDRFQIAGAYSVVWDGKNEAGQQLSSGAYIYTLQSGNERRWRKMLLLK